MNRETQLHLHHLRVTAHQWRTPTGKLVHIGMVQRVVTVVSSAGDTQKSIKKIKICYFVCTFLGLSSMTRLLDLLAGMASNDRCGLMLVSPMTAVTGIVDRNIIFIKLMHCIKKNRKLYMYTLYTHNVFLICYSEY